MTSPTVTSSLLESVSISIFSDIFIGSACDVLTVSVSNCSSLLSHKNILHIVLNMKFHAHWQVESGDLAKYGLIPEFIGRLPILVNLAALNEDQLVQVV